MFITLDGIDGVGKGTQSRMLYDYFTGTGRTAVLISFPQYDSFFGRMIGDYLNGRYGGLDQINPKLTALLYSLDRKLFFERNDLSAYDIVICDRYVPSNIAHQSVKLDESDQEAFIVWLEELEYGINGIPKPDAVIIFDASVELTTGNVFRKKKRDYTALSHDIHESDKEYMKKVRDRFVRLTDRDGYHLVVCEEENGMKSMESIFESVKKILARYVPCP